MEKIERTAFFQPQVYARCSQTCRLRKGHGYEYEILEWLDAGEILHAMREDI